MFIARALLVPVVVLAAVAPVSSAETAPAAAQNNVSITLTIGKKDAPTGSGEKVHKFLIQEGAKSSVLMGWRTPLPTRAAEGAGEPSATSYIYQNVGVSATFETQAIGNGRYLVVGQVEISGVRPPQTVGESGKPPLIGTFNQSLRVVLPNGQKVRVTEGPDPEGGTLFLDLRVDRVE